MPNLVSDAIDIPGLISLGHANVNQQADFDSADRFMVDCNRSIENALL